MSSNFSEIRTSASSIVRNICAWRRRHRNDWVSDRVKEEGRQYRKISSARRAFGWVRRTWRSHGFWIGAILAVIIAVMVSYCVYLLAPDMVDDDRWYGLLTALWQVEASLAGITFVIAALLLESRAREARSDDIFRYYTRSCRLILLVIATFLHIMLTGVLAYLRYGSDLRGGLLDVAIIAVSIGFVLFVAANLLLWLKVLQLLGPLSSAYARRELTVGTIAQTVPEIARSISYDGYARSHLNGAPVEYCGLRYDSDWETIRATSDGLVRDINLARTDDLGRRLARDGAGVESGIVLTKRIGDLVTEGDIIARVHPSSLNSGSSSVLRKVYRIRKAASAPSTELARSLASLREEIVDHLHARRDREAGISLATFRMSVAKMLALWDIHGTEKDVTEVRFQYLFGCPLSASLHQVQLTTEELLGRAAETGTERVLSNAMIEVCRLLMRCRIQRQCGLFRLLCSGISRSYQRTAENGLLDGPRRLLVEHVCEHVTQLAHDISGSSTLRGRAVCQASDDLEYVRELAVLYGDLLKAASDHEDEFGFDFFQSALVELRQRRSDDSSTIGPTMHEVALTDLGVWIDMVALVIGAWILRRLMDGTLDSAPGSLMLDRICDCFNTHEELARLYRTYLMESSYFAQVLGLNEWTLPVLPRPWSYSPGFHDMVHTFYSFEGLRLCSAYHFRRAATAYSLSLDPVALHVKADLSRFRRVPLRNVSVRIKAAAGRLQDVIDEETLAHLDEFVALHGPPGPDDDEVHVTHLRG